MNIWAVTTCLAACVIIVLAYIVYKQRQLISIYKDAFERVNEINSKRIIDIMNDPVFDDARLLMRQIINEPDGETRH